MPDQFDIFFNGQILDDRDLDEVKAQVGKIFKVEGKKLERLFSGKATCIKAGVDAATASKYRKVFRDAGALVEIKSTADQTAQTQSATESAAAETKPEMQPTATDKAEETQPPTTDQDESDMTLLPANTGSLIDCATEVTPQPIPQTVDLELTSAGTTIDESAPPTPAEIDTEGLSLNPPNSGSLEEFQRQLDPIPIPDISELSLDDIEENKQESIDEES
jgi:hypothetical protein